METPVHPTREALAHQAEADAQMFRSRAAEAADNLTRNVADVFAQLLLGRAAALRGPHPVLIPGPGGEPLVSYPDGRIEPDHD